MSNYQKLDFWSLKAQKEGYPARSVYKLQEIDKKFGLLPKSKGQINADYKVLELGAAPGSWSLYILRKFDGCGFLAACDISPLSDHNGAGLFAGQNFFFKQADIFAADTQAELAAKGPYCLILSDAAPSTSGDRGLDTARSEELVRAALSYAAVSLRQDGALCIKIFQGQDTAALIKETRPKFKQLKTFKPEACRSSSFETYIVGLGFKKTL
ncbi:MAG: RlmE family RNA methyltransferase [Spirochaetaceae bacterium]|jgi:23S rRNA (uridine2552-2'-O)-methyltransferase|nr:RlmE family RNA methyltransferase [Spirochaetaceae bacterium]